jgi:hypothetical protein
VAQPANLFLLRGRNAKDLAYCFSNPGVQQIAIRFRHFITT